ncbi:MAG TPA: hypothetical protein VKB69_16405 [Micromonosporaceae bacterium]|nr:hypothetical protein [Micromonosporaceae bacterium]
MWGRKRRERELADAREEALRWYERLGGQVMNLPKGDEPATQQALVDASERYNAAGGQLDRATSVTQYQLARETALEGLSYVRAARVAMKLDPGPPLPPLAGQRGAGAIRQDREVQVAGQSYRASANPGVGTPYYYPGGQVAGRPVPMGWYSEPWWKTALVAGAWGVGSVLIFDALLAPSFGDFGHGGYDSGYDQGYDAGQNQGYDQGYDAGQDSQDQGGYDSGGYDQGGYDSGGGYDGGGYDGGGFDGGGFDPGGFDGGGGFDGF